MGSVSLKAASGLNVNLAVCKHKQQRTHFAAASQLTLQAELISTVLARPCSQLLHTAGGWNSLYKTSR